MSTRTGTRPLYTQAMIEAAMREYLARRFAGSAPAAPAVCVGDRITARPYANAFWDGCGRPPEVCGTVEYVHPGGRWAMISFQIGRTRLRECFFPIDMHIRKEEIE